MKNASIELISDICDKIASGYNFGGWTDPLDERRLGRLEARVSNKNKEAKFKIIQKQETERDRARQTARLKIMRAQQRDDTTTVKPFRNR